MNNIMKLIIFTILVVPTLAFAQDSGLDLSALDKLGAWITENLIKSVVILAPLVEILLRMVKSDKPLSIAHSLAAGARKIAEILSDIADWMDAFLPQKKK